jgi:superfamily II DNA or RNA helicase
MNKLKDGEDYERYVLNIIKDKYKKCYLWKYIPDNILEIRFYKNNNICDDIGCDIIGIKYDDTIDYIQCKNYSTTGEDNIINIHDLAGFYNFIAENSIINAIVYYSGKLSQQILCRQNKIKYINIPHIKNNNILDFKPRDYQLESYNKLKDINRSVLSMPCGTGKTFVSFLLSLDYKNIIILTPLISTTEQILTHYKNYYSKYKDINYISINCNAERNINNIKFNENKNIIASTYDSSDIIIKLLEKNTLENTLIIIDEFHNLSNDMIINNKNNMNKILKSNNKILFISATPLDTINYKEIFGENKYELDWKTAIDNKYICDYNFYYPNNDKIITRIDDLKIDKTLIEKTILINKSYFLLESIKLTNIKKCIVYLKTIKECNEFIKILKTINIYFELNLKIYEITCNTTKKKRTEFLNKFKNDNSCINIICNVHVLDEGIDIPECDSVYLTHPNNNPINIIQRISRANRLDINNKDKIAKIFIWSKDNIKLKNIMKNINKTIDIKYGNENNDYVNKNILIEKEINNLNIICDKQKNKTIEKIIEFMNFDRTNIVFDENNNYWFNAKHLCILLKYNNYKKALKNNITDRKDILFLKDILSNYKSLYKNVQGHTKFISEIGVYSLIFKSKMENAEKIRNLISDELINLT